MLLDWVNNGAPKWLFNFTDVVNGKPRYEIENVGYKLPLVESDSHPGYLRVGDNYPKGDNIWECDEVYDDFLHWF